MNYIAFLATPSKNDHITIINPDRPQSSGHPSTSAVPDSGSTWAFILAAVITVGFAAVMRRYHEKSANTVSRG